MSLPLPDGLSVPDACPAVPTIAPPPPLPRVAWVLAALALGIRLAAAAREPVPPRDGVALAEAVRALAGGEFAGVLTGPHQPLALLLAAPLAACGLDPLLALALVAALAGAALTLPLFSVTRRLFDDGDAAAAAALLHAVTPTFVRIESTALTEGVFLLATFLSLGAALRALRHYRPGRDALLAGLFGGLAWLARPEGVVPAAMALLVVLPRGGGRPLAHRVRGLAAAASGVALAALPWVLARAAAGGSPGPFPGKSVAVLAGTAAADLGGAATGQVRGLAGSALQALGALPEALHPALVPMVLLGFVALVRMPRCGRTLGAVAVPLLQGLLFYAGLVLLEWRYGYGGRRHAAAAAAMLLPFAGAGFLAAGALLRRAEGPFARPTVALGTLLAVATTLLAGASLLRRDFAGRDARELGLALRAAAGAGPLRVATFGEPRVAWYAGGTDVRLRKEFGVPPGAGEGDAVERARRLREWLASPDAPDFVVFRDGDDRTPPGFPPEGTEEPAARAGRLTAWRPGALR